VTSGFAGLDSWPGRRIRRDGTGAALPDRAAGRLSDRRGVRLKPSEHLRKIAALLTILVSHRAEQLGPRIFMQLLASRDYPVIDYQTMGEFNGHERLFRATDGAFLLHMSSEGKLEAEERIIWLTVRDAISWLNEVPDEFGSFWECAVDAPFEPKQIQHIGPTF
jgi:hypothetical protein